MLTETMTIADEEKRLRELNKQDPFDLQPAVIEEKLTDSVSKDQYDQLIQLNHRLKEQVNDLMAAQEQLDNRLATRTK